MLLEKWSWSIYQWHVCWSSCSHSCFSDSSSGGSSSPRPGSTVPSSCPASPHYLACSYPGRSRHRHCSCRQASLHGAERAHRYRAAVNTVNTCQHVSSAVSLGRLTKAPARCSTSSFSSFFYSHFRGDIGKEWWCHCKHSYIAHTHFGSTRHCIVIHRKQHNGTPETNKTVYSYINGPVLHEVANIWAINKSV